MSNLRIKLKSYLDASIKKKDDLSVSTVRLIIAAIKDRDIEYRAKNEANEINDPEILIIDLTGDFIIILEED